jgi:hypothetical protein
MKTDAFLLNLLDRIGEQHSPGAWRSDQTTLRAVGRMGAICSEVINLEAL